LIDPTPAVLGTGRLRSGVHPTLGQGRGAPDLPHPRPPTTSSAGRGRAKRVPAESLTPRPRSCRWRCGWHSAGVC